MINFKQKLKDLDNLPRKEFLDKVAKVGLGVFVFSLINPSVFAKVFELRNDDAVAININEIRGITNGTINRDVNGLVTSIVINGRTITISRDGNDLIDGYSDGNYTWTITRTDGVITSWSVN